MKKYSVIIPIYNAEKTLRRCVESLLNQQRDDAEIILVNDGSTDDCEKICREYANNYPQVKYFAKNNGGVSSARNIGIGLATGRFITFVDSDDYVSDNYFAVIDKSIDSTDCDLLQFSYANVGSNQSEILHRFIQPSFYSTKKESIVSVIQNGIIRRTVNSPINKVYKREIINENKLVFPEKISIGEDTAFNVSYTVHVESYKMIEDVLYFVSIDNNNSLSRQLRKDLDSQSVSASKFMREKVADCGLNEYEKKQIYLALNFDIMRNVYTKAKYLHKEKVPFFKRLNKIHILCRDINKQKFTYPKTRFCRLISLPVRWNLALVIDAMAWKLTR